MHQSAGQSYSSLPFPGDEGDIDRQLVLAIIAEHPRPEWYRFFLTIHCEDHKWPCALYVTILSFSVISHRRMWHETRGMMERERSLSAARQAHLKVILGRNTEQPHGDLTTPTTHPRNRNSPCGKKSTRAPEPQITQSPRASLHAPCSAQNGSVPLHAEMCRV